MDVLTGFPGFIGRRLAARLADADAKTPLVALVEPRQVDAARGAAADIAPAGIEILAADISKPRLGLGEDDYERLRAEARRVYHLAAIYNLAVPLEVAQRVNVEGTGNVLELCAAAERLERLAYVSTAYVAGLRTGIVYEHELALGQGFKNHYESTKFQAEVWVRQAMERVPTTIYRPAIVVGDSRTGETQKFDGPYYMLRVVSFAERRGWPIPQFGRAEAPFNVVPVDFVVDALAAAGAEPAAVGQTLHLVEPEPVTAAELLAILSRAYAGREPAYRIPPEVVTALLRLATVRRAFGGAPRESIKYLNHPVRFDTRRAVSLLEPRGLRPPNFRSYVEPMVEFFRAHEEDPRFVPA
jgi:thioester reductase-like protein